ncbi:hypothetical protein [Streptomyces sp. NRRL S-118]|uniref:hypothetical protein n=1 Tax=Streptomyces sp. NRRL S-118 TaxID=1463881 RepID=UPI00131DE849|nr:hypothetical protein [Streptomyces sp. NRRL S-118]
MSASYWSVLVFTSACSVVPAVALSMRTGMSRLDAQELHRRRLLVHVLRTNLSKALSAGQHVDAVDADAIGVPGAVEQQPLGEQQRTVRAVDR